MQAIHVKVMAPTMSRGTRFKAIGLNMCKVEDMDYALDAKANAMFAAQQLIDDYNMQQKDKQVKPLGIGTLPDNTYAVLLTYK